MDVGTAVQADLVVAGQRISGRYRIESAIGRGGAALVYCAYDEREGRRIALKLLQRHEAPRTLERLAALFRHEFLVLAQVAHPNVVKVYDFGFEAGQPYYTMELLEGQPLSQAAPLPPDTVAALLRALCEPLAILHARRWVHRDLSPHNVMVASDGQVKLIDFGATVSMDGHHQPVGTPPCMPPEVLHQQQLDARADVFGLGALAYFALTGQHAYPARTLARLPSVWATLPTRPSELRPEVPEALEELLLAMLSIEPSGRPRSTAEVVHRLQGGSRASLAPNVATARAYLETPKLVGRDAQVAQLRGMLRRATNGRGVVCVIRGDAGLGRTRLLDTLAIEARLAGHAVIRAGARALSQEPLSLAKALGQAALHGLSEELAAQDARGAELDWLHADVDLSGDSAKVASAQRAFVAFVLGLCAKAPLALLVDDVEAGDVASQKLLAQLAMLAHKHRLMLAVTSGPSAPAPASPLRVLIDHGAPLELAPLTESDVEDWARSVFGDVHNVARLSRWLHPVSEGKPAACMALAEYLVERGVAVLSGGTFRLPDSFDDLHLPGSVREALYARLSELGPAARRLLELVAMDVQPLPLELADYVDAFAERGGDGITALAELTAAQVLVATASGYVLGRSGALDWARAQLTSERERELHRELADWHGKRIEAGSASALLYAGYHLWKAGDLAAADALIGDGRLLRQATGNHTFHFYRSEENIAFHEALLAYRKQNGGSPAALYPLRIALLVLASTTKPELVVYADETLRALERDLGLDRWDELPPELSDAERLARCLQAAERAHTQASEAERGLAPLDALRYFGTTAAILSGVYAVRYEPAPLWPLLQTIKRLRALAPTFGLISDVLEIAFITLAWGADARAMQRRVLETTSQPIPNLDESLRNGVRGGYGYYLGMHLAAEGNDEALAFAPALEERPLTASLGLQIRRVHALMTGRYREAQRYRRERELLALQSESSDHHLHMSLLRELHAAFNCGDLLEVTRYVSAIRRRAERFPGWQPWAMLATAEVHFLLEEFAEARAQVDAALAGLEPLSHGAWEHLMNVRAHLQLEAGEYAEALATANDVLDRARALGIKTSAECRLLCAVALAHVGLGRAAQGVGELEALLETLAVSPGTGSVTYGIACEVRCRIALMMNDRAAFAEFHGRIAELYREHPGLRARYERLERRARERFDVQGGAGAARDDGAQEWAKRISTAMATQSIDDQADYLLSLLLEQVDAGSGQLYRISSDGQPQLVAARPQPPDPKLLVQAQRCCETYSGGEETATRTLSGLPESAIDSVGTAFEPIWLVHPDHGGRLSGLLLVPRDAPHLVALTPGLRRAVAQQLAMLK